jgi:ADP-heptose:LPS heptosyltransferase
MPQKKHSYQYKQQRVYSNGYPLHKRTISRIEFVNKLLWLRLMGKLFGIKPLDNPLPLEEVNSVLFLRYDALGDMIVTTPLWRILKRVKPSIKIGVAGSYKNIDILSCDPNVDKIYDYSAKRLADFTRITKPVRKEKWDVVIVCAATQKTRNAIISKLSSPKGINATIGSRSKVGHQNLFSRLISLPGPMQMIPALQYLLRNTIVIPNDDFEDHPSIYIDPQALLEVQASVTDYLQSVNKDRFILLNTDAPEFKKWGYDKNFELAAFILEQFPRYGLILSGLKENASEIESRITAMTVPGARYIGTPSIHHLAALVELSTVVISPDTSVVHLAEAKQKPVVAFYLEKNEWLPYKIPHVSIIPPKGTPIKDIPVSTAKNAFSRMLNAIEAGATSDIHDIVEL